MYWLQHLYLHCLCSSPCTQAERRVLLFFVLYLHWYFNCMYQFYCLWKCLIWQPLEPWHSKGREEMVVEQPFKIAPLTCFSLTYKTSLWRKKKFNSISLVIHSLICSMKCTTKGTTYVWFVRGLFPPLVLRVLYRNKAKCWFFQIFSSKNV